MFPLIYKPHSLSRPLLTLLEMAQFAGYAFFLAVHLAPNLNYRPTINSRRALQHLSTPLFEKGQVVASPVLLDAITARLQAQLEAHRVMLETGMSITVPFNSPEQAALPRVCSLSL